MPVSLDQELDKAALGRRIKQIRLESDLKQWQLAEKLGTTQSAVHKYENGVVPEPRRLIRLARLGGTTVEWLLTGHHWENGSEDRARIPEEVYRIAQATADLGPERLRTLSEALELLERACTAVAGADGAPVDDGEAAALLRSLSPNATRALAAALALHRSVVDTALDVESRRFEEMSGRPVDGEADEEPAPDETLRRRS